jgi:hypothetical protein
MREKTALLPWPTFTQMSPLDPSKIRRPSARRSHGPLADTTSKSGKGLADVNSRSRRGKFRSTKKSLLVVRPGDAVRAREPGPPSAVPDDGPGATAFAH